MKFGCKYWCYIQFVLPDRFGVVMSCDRASWRSDNALHFSSEVVGSNLCRNIGYTDWDFHGFAQFLQTNGRIVSRLGCDRVLPNRFQFIIHRLSNYLTLYRQRYWNVRTVNYNVCHGMDLFVVWIFNALPCRIMSGLFQGWRLFKFICYYCHFCAQCGIVKWPACFLST
jgi:hypothetical protein